MGRIEVGGIAALPFILHFQQSGTSRGGGRGRKKVNLYLRSKRFAPSTARVKGEIAVEAATTSARVILEIAGVAKIREPGIFCNEIYSIENIGEKRYTRTFQ